MSRLPRLGLFVAFWGFVGVVLYWSQYSYRWFVVEPRTVQERLLGWSLPASRLLEHHRSFAYDGSGSDEWEFSLNPEEIGRLKSKCLPPDREVTGTGPEGHEPVCYLAENINASTKITELVQVANDRLRVVRIVE